MLLEAIRQEFGWKKNYLSEASKQNNHPGSVSHPSFAGGESQSSPPEKGESPKEEGVTIFIAAADCTGHGVPGAMVSVVCSNALNRAVKEFELRNTGKILDKVTDLVLETFEKSASDVKDGMDISLLKIDFLQNQEGNLIPDCIEWSGANNPLWYSQNQEMQEITADKQPIGKNDNRKPFTTHYINCKPQNTERYFYLFTDGYADQFGGEKGKKFKYKPFKELLLSINKNPMEKQKTIISETIVNWKGDLEQVDDICVIGIKI
jgi:hypothetical protein